MAILRRRWSFFLGALLGLASLSLIVVRYESHKAQVDGRLQQQRADTEAKLKSLQEQFENFDELERQRSRQTDASDDQRRKLECELLKSRHSVDFAGWRNDTIHPSPNRLTPFPIDIPDPAASREPLVPELAPKQR